MPDPFETDGEFKLTVKQSEQPETDASPACPHTIKLPATAEYPLGPTILEII
jgi:hypothetical protein